MQAQELQRRLNECRPWIIAKNDEDTFQEICVRCYERLSKDRTWQPGYGMIKKMAVSIVVDAKRKQSTAERWRAERRSDSRDPHSLTQTNHLPEARCIVKERRTILGDALKKVRPEYASVITKIYFDGLTVQEIANESGIAKNTIKSWRTRAMKQLKAVLQETPYFINT